MGGTGHGEKAGNERQLYCRILPLPHSVHFLVSRRLHRAVPTRQTSSSGRPKSPRIQVVLPEDLCGRLAALAEAESRTMSNMAKVLIQQGVERMEQQRSPHAVRNPSLPASMGVDRFRQELERQGQQQPRRLRGVPRRLRLHRPMD